MSLPKIFLKIQDSLPVGESDDGTLSMSEAPVSEIEFQFGPCEHESSACWSCIPNWTTDYAILGFRFEAAGVRVEDWEATMNLIAGMYLLMEGKDDY